MLFPDLFRLAKKKYTVYDVNTTQLLLFWGQYDDITTLEVQHCIVLPGKLIIVVIEKTAINIFLNDSATNWYKRILN